HAEAAEELVERRSAPHRLVTVEAHHLGAAVALDADGDDRGLHLLDDVGKSGWTRNGLRVRGDGERRGAHLRPRAAEQRGGADGGNAAKKRNATRGETAAHTAGGIFGRSHVECPSGFRCSGTVGREHGGSHVTASCRPHYGLAKIRRARS